MPDSDADGAVQETAASWEAEGLRRLECWWLWTPHRAALEACLGSLGKPNPRPNLKQIPVLECYRSPKISVPQHAGTASQLPCRLHSQA